MVTRSSPRAARAFTKISLRFFHVVVDVPVQHLHRGVELLVDLTSVLDRRDQVLGAGVLHLRFVQQVCLLDRLAQSRIEDSYSICACTVSSRQICMASSRFFSRWHAQPWR